ncbi:hypothetical protein AB0J52_30460 [Spirillospora sp. NPDC049652]
MRKTLTAGAAAAILGVLLSTTPAQAGTLSETQPVTVPCSFPVLAIPGLVMPMPMPMPMPMAPATCTFTVPSPSSTTT